MADRSSRPCTSPRRTPTRTERRIIKVRLLRRWGPARIAGLLRLNPATVHRVLVRYRLNRLAWTDRATGRVIRRYEHDRPGDLVHVDIKKLGNIPDGGGHKVLGRAAGRKTRSGAGYSYIHTAVDDHSRLAYSEILADENGPTCAAFILRAADYFANHGITAIERVITDNHFSYRRSNDFKAAIAALGAKHKFIRPHCPWQNGKVERYNRTLQTEWAYRHVYTSNAERTAALAPWLENYNTHRRHSALGGHPPISRLQTPT